MSVENSQEPDLDIGDGKKSPSPLPASGASSRFHLVMTRKGPKVLVDVTRKPQGTRAEHSQRKPCSAP